MVRAVLADLEDQWADPEVQWEDLADQWEDPEGLWVYLWAGLEDLGREDLCLADLEDLWADQVSDNTLREARTQCS